MRREWTIAVLLAGITLALYWPVRHFDLIYFDDPVVLTDTPEVQAGLTWPAIKWACTGVVIANWHPVTNLSFLAVSQFFGNTPGANHLANACIHAVNAALVFLLLRRLTGATWRSATVAAIFAWHPLRVESVAWIVERKDVLCAFFFLSSLSAYAGYAQAKSSTAAEKNVLPQLLSLGKSYWLALILFALALLSKPMAVTLPFVLLLLDVWPLQRVPVNHLKFSDWQKPLFEKIPFFALMILFCGATYWIQHDYAAMTPWAKLGLAPRVANSIAGYLAYLAQLFWPLNLAVIYPFPKSFDTTETILKAALLLAVSGGCLLQFKRRPQLAVGWCWYLGTALPVIGIIQVGEQAMADRYTYLPLIGPVMALVWTAAELCSRAPGKKIVLGLAGILVPAMLLLLTARQLQYWQDTVELFTHNVAVTPDNGSAYFTLGLGYEHAGDTNRALIFYRVAKELSPGDRQIRLSLASLLARQNHVEAAENEYAGVLSLNPEEAAAHVGLAGLLTAQGRAGESIAELNAAVQFSPDSTEALNNLAWALATEPQTELRDGPRAVALALRACELTKFKQTIFIGTLGAAYAEAGKFEDAVITAQRACDLAAKHGETNLLENNRQLLELYQAHQPVRRKD